MADIREHSTSNGYIPPKSYGYSKDGKSIIPLKNENFIQEQTDFFSRCKQTLAEIFLPYGYPDSVSEDYLAYQFWDTVQAFCSSLVSTLATHAVLTGLGVGSEDATPLAATMTWLTKDGLGMVGRITFVWLKGCDLDNDLKRWRFVADILNDAAFFVDMLSAAVPRYLFTAMVCFSSASRSIVGVAGGATRTALVQHQARQGNAADVAAKDGSQETIVNLSALIVSLLLVPAVEGKLLLVWFLYAVLTFFHIYANFRAVKTLCLQTFNDKRLGIVMAEYLNNNTVPHYRTVNELEPVLLPGNVFRCQVRLGVSLAEIFKSLNWRADEWARLQHMFIDENFVACFDLSSNSILVAFSEDAEAKDVVFCGYFCYILSHAIDKTSTDVETQIVTEFYRKAVKSRQDFFDCASNSGWNVSAHNLTISGKFRYGTSKKDS